MQMKQLILIAMLAGSILWIGCRKSKESVATDELITNQVAPVVLEPWAVRAKELTVAVKIGMTDDEVVNAIGEPKMVTTAIGAQGDATWQYELGAGNWFTVQFDKSNRVTSLVPPSSTKLR